MAAAVICPGCGGCVCLPCRWCFPQKV